MMTKPSSLSISLDDLYPKTLSVVHHMARTLMGIQPGEQLPTIQDWMATTVAGAGTIQAGLAILEKAGAIQVTSRGGQGSVLQDRALDRLWEFSGLSSLIGALPLPYSLEFQGVATALEREFQAQNLPVHLVYVNGSDVRFDGLLHQRWDFVVTSRWVAERFVRTHEAMIVHHFSAGTYYAKNSVGVLRRADDPEAIRTVGRDESSGDHRALSEAEFSNVRWVNVPYGQLPWVIHRRTVDAAIWHSTALTPMGIMDDLTIAPLQQDNAKELAERMNEAVIVARRAIDATHHVLHALRVDAMEAMHAAVIAGDTIPFYG